MADQDVYKDYFGPDIVIVGNLAAHLAVAARPDAGISEDDAVVLDTQELESPFGQDDIIVGTPDLPPPEKTYGKPRSRNQRQPRPR